MKHTLALVLMVFISFGTFADEPEYLKDFKEVLTDIEKTCYKVVLRDGIFFDLETNKPANGKYLMKECGPHNLKLTEEYKNGKSHGTFDTYFENGQLFTREHYKDGQLHGIRESYLEDGSLYYKICHIEGMLKTMEECINTFK
ncbi:MAG: hypothetical protein HN522_05365 [Flavobacteriales bacterium]|jgi:antitoxin component YwqK of YwqJK toxin-antitoxin module|nr:hypothetical protein [Flavobacteriales bacterium]